METPTGHDQNADQIAFWNGLAGQHWTDRQQAQDTILAPVSDVLIDRVKARAGERIVDVGCGCGATTIALAQKVGPTGHVLGIDISAPMLARARQIAPAGLPADFVLGDATVYPFQPASFDLLVSRFGVMFFAEPALSFANMRWALRPSARLAFACWREPRENPWMMAPLQAAYKHVPKLPQLGPDDPGPFSFASEQRVTGILGEAGFRGIEMEPRNLSLDIAVGRGLDAAVEGALEIGPAARAL
jgi:SAM-dependent methyltransferase